LDEPQTGLDPKARKDVRNFILDLKKIGKTIFLSSHLLYEISEVADRIAIINHGKIIAFDTLDNLEAKSEKSIIQFEMLKSPVDNIQQYLEDLKKVIYPLSGIEEKARWIKYNSDTRIFQVFFDGKSSNQFKILQALIEKGYNIIEFSVPKAGLLEDLFIELTQSHRMNMEE
jgi:ABC-2 type transport system ATP-binding protein